MRRRLARIRRTCSSWVKTRGGRRPRSPSASRSSSLNAVPRLSRGSWRMSTPLGARRSGERLRVSLRGSSDRDIYRLDPDQRVRLAAILEDPLEDPTHDVKRADPVGSGVHQVDPDQLVGPGLDRVAGILTGAAVEDDVVGGLTQELLPIQAMIPILVG